jgi:hypothetical protein
MVSPTSTRTTTRITPKRYSVGVDLGQAADYTAICVIEKTVGSPETALFAPIGETPGDRLVDGEPVYNVRYLKRPRLGTPYDTIAERVGDLICQLEPQGAFGERGQVTLSVDGTGVGRGVVDMLRKEFSDRAKWMHVPKLDFRAVTVTGSQGSSRRPKTRREYWSVPKKELVFGAVAAFQQKKLRIASGVAERDTLVNELLNYRRNINIATGNLEFEPWREKDHDDLLFAACLALWGWTQREPQWSLRVVA